jgi:hypothetical protein
LKSEPYWRQNNLGFHAATPKSCVFELWKGGSGQDRPFQQNRPVVTCRDRQLRADSVEKVGSAAARRSDVPAVEVAASHFKLPSGVSLSVLAQV